jgi:hypothetical protein
MMTQNVVVVCSIPGSGACLFTLGRSRQWLCFVFFLVNCLSLEALEVQERVTACTTQSGKGISCEQHCQEAW